MKNNVVIIALLVAVIAGAGGFFIGAKYQQSKRPVFNRQSGSVQGARFFSGQNGGDNRANFRPVSGEIISSDGNSVTVKLSDGSSKIVVLSDSTQINKADSATKDDLQNGTKVAVFGQTNSDGSVTAQNIQINPVVNSVGM